MSEEEVKVSGMEILTKYIITENFSQEKKT